MLDPQLFELIVPVVQDAIIDIQEYLADNGYTPRYYTWPSYYELPNGLPSFSESGLGPIKYSDFLILHKKFGLGFSKTSQYQALSTYVHRHQRWSQHCLPESYSGDDDLIEFYLNKVLGSIVERLMCFKEEPTEANIRIVYEPLEAYIYGDNLKFSIVVPILFLKFDRDFVSTTTGLYVKRMDDNMQMSRMRVGQSSDGQYSSRGAATHALVLKLVGNCENQNSWEFQKALSNEENYDVFPIKKFFSMLRIVTGHTTGYGQLLVSPVGWASKHITTLEPLMGTATDQIPHSHRNYWQWRGDEIPTVSESELKQVAELFEAWEILIRGDKQKEIKRLELACSRLNLSYLRQGATDSILDACIGLEALLSDGSTEITHKLASRLAALSKLDNDPHPAIVFHDIKQIYGVRSKIVHGATSTPQNISENNQKAIQYLRQTIRLLLLHPEFLSAQEIDTKLLWQ